jgi:acetyl-CoA carboxylase carboxyltransferase component
MLRLFAGQSKKVPTIAYRALSATTWGTVLDGDVPHSPEYHANKLHMAGIVTNLKETMTKIHEGGGEKAKAKQKARNKMLARERIDGLVDPGTPFLEVGMLAGLGMYGDWVPSGGIVTGIGSVNGYNMINEYKYKLTIG